MLSPRQNRCTHTDRGGTIAANRRFEGGIDGVQQALGRHLGSSAGAGGRCCRLQQPHAAHEPAHQHRRRPAARAHIECLWRPAAADPRRPYCAARQGPGHRSRFRPQADLRRQRRHGDRWGRGAVQRSGRPYRAGTCRSRWSASTCPARSWRTFRSPAGMPGRRTTSRRPATLLARR